MVYTLIVMKEGYFTTVIFNSNFHPFSQEKVDDDDSLNRFNYVIFNILYNIKYYFLSIFIC